MYLSLLFGAAISRISVKRSMSTLDDAETVDASRVVRTAVGCDDCCADAIFNRAKSKRFCTVETQVSRTLN